jgi:hypothetical protein
MRMTLLAAAAVIGFGIAATSATSAAPVYGASASTAAAHVDMKQDVWWRGRGWGWGWRGRGWCYYHPYRC